MTEQEKLQHYWQLAIDIKTDDEKAIFFDQNEEAFSLDPGEGDELQNAKYSFCEEMAFSQDESDDFEENSWKSFPKEFKVYAFNYCILDGTGFEQVKGLLTIKEIVSLVQIEKLNETLEENGISIFEAEEDVMLLLEKKIKRMGRSATEDNLYDATNKIISDLRDWMDDNHPDNIAAA